MFLILNILSFLYHYNNNTYYWPTNINEKCELLSNITKKSSKYTSIGCYNDFIISNSKINLFNNYKKNISNDFIIILKSNPSYILNSKQKLIQKISDSEKNYATIKNIYSNCINGFSATLSPFALEEFLLDDSVINIEKDQIAYTQTFQENPIWNLDRIDQTTNNLNNLYNTGNLDGNNIHIYILDTGININHIEFLGRVGNSISFVNDKNGFLDCNGHGTHCAGTVSGTKWGVAKKSIIHSVRVLDCQGRGIWSDIIAGIDWVVSQIPQYQESLIISLSIGGPFSNSINKAINNAYQKGVFIVVAAGNENTDACTKSPSSARNAITIASTTINDKRSSFSNYGNCINIFAPGSNIKSASNNNNDGFNILSGTSMACPHVAGVLALFIEWNYKNNNKLTNDRLINLLYDYATKDQLSDTKSINLLIKTPNNLIKPPLNRCMTNKGPIIGSLCKFPFIFKGKTYTSCTIEFDPLNLPWCSTKTDSFNRHIKGNWGNCNSYCKLNNCITISGPNVNKQCVFPFEFKGNIFTKCTKQFDPDGLYWCSTLTDSSKKHVSGNWGHCSSNCITNNNLLIKNPTKSPSKVSIINTSDILYIPTNKQKNITNNSTYSFNNIYICSLFNLINQFRIQNDLLPLVLDKRLVLASKELTIERSIYNNFKYFNNHYNTIHDIVIKKKYEWTIISEMNAAGFRDPSQIINLWKKSNLNSPNLLCINCRHIGISVLFNKNTIWKYYYSVIISNTEQKLKPYLINCNTSKKCITNGGLSINTPCKFPFKYYGILYSKCIYTDNNKPWCSTKVDINNNHIAGKGNWGYCPNYCIKQQIKCLEWQWWCKGKKAGIIGYVTNLTTVQIPKLIASNNVDNLTLDEYVVGINSNRHLYISNAIINIYSIYIVNLIYLNIWILHFYI